MKGGHSGEGMLEFRFPFRCNSMMKRSALSERASRSDVSPNCR